MAWTAPTTRSTGDLITASIWNTDNVDNLSYLKTRESPVGEIIMWATDTAPSYWLLCDGSAVSRTTYNDLFGVIGTTFGAGDGSTTFNLPDMRGRTPLGQDDMGGTSANRVTDTQADSLGGSGGEETHTLTTNEMPTHNHNSASGILIRADITAGSAIAVHTTASSTDAGGGAAHNNMPPWLTLNFCIYAGV